MTVRFRVVAFVILLLIAFSTLAPAGLRPHVIDANVERFGAFLIFGLALGLGWPRSAIFSVAVVLLVAVALEVLQVLDPTRDGRVLDAIVKVLGGLSGIAVVWVLGLALQWGGGRPHRP